jgi:Na+-driven multidrug efflux pump
MTSDAAPRTRLFVPTLRLAVPSIVENFLHSAVYSVDMLMLASLGESALAASALTSMFLWRMTAVTASLQFGAAAYISRRWGESRFALARAAAMHALALAGLCGAVVGSVLILILPWVFRALGGNTEVVNLATAFTTPILVVFPLIQMRVILGASLRAAGDTLTPQLATLVVNVLNVAFNYVLIYGKFGMPALGMPGAGLGTAAAITCGFLFLLFRSTRGVKPRRLFDIPVIAPPAKDALLDPTPILGVAMAAAEPGAEFAAGLPIARAETPRSRSALAGTFKFSRRGMRLWIPGVTAPILRVSGSALIEELLVTAGFFGFIRLISGMGTMPLAAHAAVSAIESFSFNTGGGFAVAASTLVGQALGRRDPALALRAMWLCLVLAITAMGTLGIIFSTTPEWFLHWFSPKDAGPVFMLLAIQLLLIAAIEQPLLGATQTLGGCLRGAGDTLSPTLAQLIGTIAVRLGLGYWLAYPMGLGIIGLYFATIIDWGARATFLAACVLGGRWRRVKV